MSATRRDPCSVQLAHTGSLVQPYAGLANLDILDLVSTKLGCLGCGYALPVYKSQGLLSRLKIGATNLQRSDYYYCVGRALLTNRQPTVMGHAQRVKVTLNDHSGHEL
jgi:hypothetical protein